MIKVGSIALAIALSGVAIGAVMTATTQFSDDFVKVAKPRLPKSTPAQRQPPAKPLVASSHDDDE